MQRKRDHCVLCASSATTALRLLIDPPPSRGQAALPRNIGATSRMTLDVNPQVQDTNVALHVTADRPIVVERVSYFARPSGLGATSSTGLTR